MAFSNKLLVRAAALCLPLTVGGCFQPMYAPTSGRDVVSEAKAISIAPIPGLVGHYLENELRFALNGSGTPASPRYTLQITVTERTQTPLVDTVTGRATSNSIYSTAQYKLIPIDGKGPVTEGSVIGLASYDRTSQRFANIRAARDAEIRNAKLMASDIRTRIVAELATR